MKTTAKITAVLLVLALVGSASARVITVEVEGVVDLVNTQGGFAFDDSVNIGSAITGFCTYDTDTADQAPSEYSGRYPLISISMSVGNYTFTHDPMSSISAFFEVVPGNYYFVRSYTPRFDGTVYLDGIPKTFEDFSWTTFGLKLMYLATTLHEYFPTDELPDVDSFPDLSIFDADKVIGVSTDEGGPGFEISGEITSLTVIPEPTTYYVDATDGSDDNDGLSPQTAFATIQKAIDSALDGDTVLVADGTYTGPGNRDIDLLGKAITVRSESGPENCIIDCNGTETDPHRGFYFHSGEDENSILDGFTIIHGVARHGGAIFCEFNSSPTITNCIISGNSARYDGGAISCAWESNPTITNCTIIGNSADHGGGIYCFWQSHPTITNCTINGNSARFGGGIYCSIFGSLTIINCIITDNTAFFGGGGGIFCWESSQMISNCTITDNEAKWGDGGGICFWGSWGSRATINNCTISRNLAKDGGGIYCTNGSLTATNCTISDNSGVSDGLDPASGGGIYCEDSNAVITRCTISGNLSDNGGGISCDECNTTMINCIISGNAGQHLGGGISLWESDAEVINCTISGNFDPRGGGISSWESDLAITNCILWNNADSEIEDSAVVSYSDIRGGWDGTGNIDADPRFVDPGYWADANDPNIVVEPNDPNAIWVDGDYHLKSEGWRWDTQRKIWTWDDVTSRCIDAGNPGSPVGEELLTIPVDPNNEWGQNLRINMGAFGGTAEASMAPFNWVLLADLTNDGTVNFEDYAAQAIDWLESESEQPGDLNRDGTVDIADIALLTEDWLEQTSWYVP